MKLAVRRWPLPQLQSGPTVLKRRVPLWCGGRGLGGTGEGGSEFGLREVLPMYGASLSRCSATFLPLGRRLNPVNHFPHPLLHSTGAQPVAFQLRAPSLLPARAIYPDQLPGMKVPPFGLHVVIPLLSDASSLRMIPGEIVCRLQAVLEPLGILSSQGHGRAVGGSAKCHLRWRSQLTPEHEQGRCAGCGVLYH